MRGIGSSDRQLINALGELQRQWEETASTWRDQARADFEKEFIQDLFPMGRAAVASIGEIDRLLKQCIQECG
ncbi:MAG: hypothetical protein KIS92_06970 [Planctomycetota bacterium]|nr:hypothetical protein [Planctomycetota bacterium]